MSLRLATCPSTKTLRTQMGLSEHATPQQTLASSLGGSSQYLLVGKPSLYVNVNVQSLLSRCKSTPLCSVPAAETPQALSQSGALLRTFPADFLSEVVLALCVSQVWAHLSCTKTGLGGRDNDGPD